VNSERSISVILKARGVRTPPPAQVQAYLRSLSQGELAEVNDRLWRIERGTERPEDIPALLDAIRATPQATQNAQQPSAQDTGSQAAAKAPARTTRSKDRSAPKKNTAPADAGQLAWLRSHGVHVWATSAALKFELSPLRKAQEDEDAPLQYSVQLEGAKKRDGRADWEHKIIFQLTVRELPLVAAFLLGYAGEQIALHNHGPNADKSLTLQDQKGKIFCRLLEAGAVVPVPIDAMDVYRCAEIALAALHLNRPSCPPEMQLAMLRRVGTMYQAGNEP